MIIRKLSVIILAVSVLSVSAQFAQYRNTISGGLALAVGPWAEGMNPGINASFEPTTILNDFFGIGGQIDYTWLSVDIPSQNDSRAGFHFFEVSFVPKLLAPLSKDVSLYFDLDPGLNMAFAYKNNRYDSDSGFAAFFGLTFKTGVNINRFSCGFKFKTVFIDSEATQWICFNIGYIAM